VFVRPRPLSQQKYALMWHSKPLGKSFYQQFGLVEAAIEAEFLAATSDAHLVEQLS
jgi:hypothetical protein